MCDSPSHETPHHKRNIFSPPVKQRGMRNQELPVYKSEPLRLMTAMPIIVQSPTPTDEDSVPSTPLRSISRRKSRLEQWIEDQHTHPDEDQSDGTAQGSSQKPYPYLAYFDMRRARSASRDDDSGSISESFVLVDGGDESGTTCRNVFEETPPVLGFGTPPATRSYTSLLRTPPSLRAFRFSLTPSRRASPSPHHSSPSLYHHSTFERRSPSMGRHGLTACDGSLAPPRLQHGPRKTPPPASSSKSYGPWAFKRPSILGAFTPPGSDASADEGSALQLSPPRPSFSSTLTFSSGTTGVSTDPYTPNIGSPSSSASFRSKGPQPSLWSLPPDASHLHDPPNAEASVLLKPGSLRLPFSLKTSKSFRHVPTVLPIPRDKRKKKLVVSGIAKGDQARLDAVRKWCESFGEVNQITRMPNGDLHIDFRKAEVADTVCRVNARVHIAGVGSVSLSWYTGKKP